MWPRDVVLWLKGEVGAEKKVVTPREREHLSKKRRKRIKGLG